MKLGLTSGKLNGKKEVKKQGGLKIMDNAKKIVKGKQVKWIIKNKGAKTMKRLLEKLFSNKHDVNFGDLKLSEQLKVIRSDIEENINKKKINLKRET